MLKKFPESYRISLNTQEPCVLHVDAIGNHARIPCMNEREYIKLRKQIHEDFQKKISALDTVWEISNTGPVPSMSDEPNKRQPKGVAGSYVTKAVNSFGTQEFTTKDIDDRISQEGHSANRTTISHKLKALVQEGVLRVISEGKGKRLQYSLRPLMIPIQWRWKT